MFLGPETYRTRAANSDTEYANLIRPHAHFLHFLHFLRSDQRRRGDLVSFDTVGIDVCSIALLRTDTKGGDSDVGACYGACWLTRFISPEV